MGVGIEWGTTLQLPATMAARPKTIVRLGTERSINVKLVERCAGKNGACAYYDRILYFIERK